MHSRLVPRTYTYGGADARLGLDIYGEVDSTLVYCTWRTGQTHTLHAAHAPHVRSARMRTRNAGACV
eukprot:1835513-Rhodomonas_salina.1